ncbi:YlmH family RNA-binding protein [Bacillus niameyensis]|uniref:YlmH family RNA-binding protein n=1 Tax=Bacillus niameyensis TaxID=1522308 RepID=UPI0007841447|nr:RNA-binding protein [Bacillus niameyensis]
MSVLYQHFRPEEKEFVDQVLEWKQYVEQTYSPKLTDFLDPRKQYILRSILGENNEVKYELYGGADRAESKRALLYPDYYHSEIQDFQVGLYEIDYPKKFLKLDHRMVLGSIMSLGLKREKFGDIIFHKDIIQFFMAKEMEDFVLFQLNQIGKAKVSIKKRNLDQVLPSDEEWKEYETTASSLRLDVILAAAFNISRSKAQDFIQQSRTKVNWQITEQLAFECDEGDVISARGLGRCSLLEIKGKTKKDKLRVTLGLLK